MPRVLFTKTGQSSFIWKDPYNEILSQIVYQEQHAPRLGKRGLWKAVADLFQQELISQGIPDSSYFPTGKQCRERWTDHLDPTLSKEPLTDAESVQLFVYKALGSSFAEIALVLNRGTSFLRNQFHNKNRGPKSAHLRAIAEEQLRHLEDEHEDEHEDEQEDRPLKRFKGIDGASASSSEDRSRIPKRYSPSFLGAADLLVAPVPVRDFTPFPEVFFTPAEEIVPVVVDVDSWLAALNLP